MGGKKERKMKRMVKEEGVKWIFHFLHSYNDTSKHLTLTLHLGLHLHDT